MDTIKLNFHSMVDVITNSSTTIFTYQDGIKEAKELLQAVFDLSGETRKVDELFYFDVFLDDIDRYTEFIDENEDEYDIKNYPKEWREQKRYIENIIEKVLTKKIERPDWMEEADGEGNEYGYTYPTTMYIKAKDPKYIPLLDKMIRFLNSSNHEAFRDG